MNHSIDFDVAVIGGGIHGVGVAQAAAAAGYKTVLLEKAFLAHGTSRWSSKLIHGGLRYLESYEFSLVRESLAERELLLKLAPDLVKRQDFYIPVYWHTSRRPWLLRAGLSAYWALAGGSKETLYQSIPKTQWDQLDGLKTQGLQKVFRYTDAQTDDALLTQAVMNSAQELETELLMPASVEHIELKSDHAQISYQTNEKSETLTTKTIVNAAGPWARELLKKVSPAVDDFPVDNIQGTHIELPGAVQKGSYYLEVPSDKRAVFVMPWKGHTLVGTTEYKYQGNPAKVHSIDASVDYLVDLYQQFFPDQDATVLNRWAGLRVLPAQQGKAFKRSRETQLPVDRQDQPRLVSIFGGKLTGYRATALKVLKTLEPSLPKRQRLAHTHELPLSAENLKDVERSN